MWSAWFPKLSTKQDDGERRSPHRTNNIQDRIASFLHSSHPAEKECSPMLQELKTRNKVRRMSNVYEENIAAFNESNCSLWNHKTLDRTLSSKFIKPKPTQTEANKQDPKTSGNKHEALIGQLIELDIKYVEQMERLKQHFIKSFDNLPALRLKNEAAVTDRLKQELFGPIEQIHSLHKELFHPLLLAHAGDVQQLATSISKLCNRGDFSCYIIYAMDQKDCEYRRNVYYRPFIEQIVDKCGFQYDFEPVEQLTRYYQILQEILKKLRNSDASKAAILAMEKAEKDLKSVLTKVHSMRSLNATKK